MERRERELASIELDPVVFLEAMSKPADSEPQTAKARRIMRPGCCFLKLRVCALRKIKGAKTQGIIITRRVSEGLRFWVLREMKCADRNSCLDR